jgi:hypothetical protein
MTPMEAINWSENTLLPYYPLGDVKTPEPMSGGTDAK